MWYLNIYTILSLTAVILLMTVIRKFAGKHFKNLRKIILLIFSLCFLFIYSKKLAVFYLVYAIVNYMFYLSILETRRYKKQFFVLFIFLNLCAFVFLRTVDLERISGGLLSYFTAIGIVYALLKAIDSLFYAYYFNERISLINYLNYILFIPVFTSGPIMKLKDFNEDLGKDFMIDSKTAEEGVKRVIRGMFKKIVLVEILYMFYNSLLEGQLVFYKSAALLFIYYILLFLDFSGYSDIAIGFGTMLGINVPENFKKPFSSPTLTQFWRNWHITLGDWFREHVYIPVSRKGKSRVFAGAVSFGIMVLIGLWHGINPLFITWGIYHGLLLFVENVTGLTMINRRKASPAYFWSKCVLTNALVAFGTVFFSENIETAARILEGFSKF